MLAPRATLTAPSCPSASDEAIGVVVTHEGVAPGTSLQIAVGRFPGTGFPSVSAGVVLPQAAGTVAAQVPSPVLGLATGAADGEYVAYLALDGRPMGGARFTIDCA